MSNIQPARLLIAPSRYEFALRDKKGNSLSVLSARQSRNRVALLPRRGGPFMCVGPLVSTKALEYRTNYRHSQASSLFNSPHNVTPRVLIRGTHSGQKHGSACYLGGAFRETSVNNTHRRLFSIDRDLASWQPSFERPTEEESSSATVYPLRSSSSNRSKRLAFAFHQLTFTVRLFN